MNWYCIKLDLQSRAELILKKWESMHVVGAKTVHTHNKNEDAVAQHHLHLHLWIKGCGAQEISRGFR